VPTENPTDTIYQVDYKQDSSRVTLLFVHRSLMCSGPTA